MLGHWHEDGLVERHKTGVTAQMSVAFKRPCLTGTQVQIRAHVVRAEGRKRTVSAVMSSSDGTDVLATGESLYVMPAADR